MPTISASVMKEKDLLAVRIIAAHMCFFLPSCPFHRHSFSMMSYIMRIAISDDTLVSDSIM